MVFGWAFALRIKWVHFVYVRSTYTDQWNDNAEK